MATYRGKIQHNDLEGGFFELVTDSGDTYRLTGPLAANATAGQRAQITGTVESGGFGIQMSGPSLKIDALEIL